MMKDPIVGAWWREIHTLMKKNTFTIDIFFPCAAIALMPENDKKYNNFGKIAINLFLIDILAKKLLHFRRL
jgi:hypothetical protein